MRAPLNPKTGRRLRAIHRERRTGRFAVEGAGARRELFFREGGIVGVRTSVDEERLGELLVRSGRITRQHFEDASVFVRHGWRLGRILVELGILEESEIEPAVRRQALEIGARALAVPSAAVDLDESAELFETLSVPLSVASLILEAYRTYERADVLSKALTSEDRRFHPASLEEIARCSDLTPEDGYLLTRFEGGATLETVLSASNMEEERAARSLFGLVHAGLLMPEKGPGSVAAERELTAFREEVEEMLARLERLDPWRALNLPKDAGIETAHAAFRDAVRRFHPDRHHSRSDPELRRKLTRLCQIFSDAHTCLKTALNLRRSRPEESAIALASTCVPTAPPARSSASPPGTEREASANETSAAEPADADVYVREGKKALRAGDYWRAIQLLERAVSLGDDRSAIHFLLGEALSKNPRWGKQAEEAYHEAIRLDPWRHDYYVALARLYDAAGLTHRAEKVREEAREKGIAA